MDKEDYLFHYECGVSQPVSTIKPSDRDTIVTALAMHFSVTSVKAELDQMVKGMEVFKLSELFQANPQIMRQLFVYFNPLPP